MIDFDSEAFRVELQSFSSDELLATSAASAQRIFAVIER
jgi:hypothetical protein